MKKHVRAQLAIGSLGLAVAAGPLVDAAVAAQPVANTGHSPAASHQPQNTTTYLNSVNGLSADDVWAAGDGSVGEGSYQTLVEHWNGTTWTRVPSPNYESQYNMISDIVEVSPSSVWAVGYVGDGSTTDSLIMHWNGATWRRYNTLSPDFDNDFFAVDVVSADDIYALGQGCPQSGGAAGLAQTWAQQSGSQAAPIGCHAISEHWNGTRWSRAAHGLDLVRAISSTASDDVWGVGPVFPRQVGRSRGIVKHFDGTSWTTVDAPHPGSVENEWHSVRSFTPDDVWIAGSYTDGKGRRALLDRWNGSSWTDVPAPDETTGVRSLSGPSSDDLWAVGYGGRIKERVEQWNGSEWTNHPYPGRTHRYAGIYGLDAFNGSDAWAVGSYYDTTGDVVAFLLHWDGSHWQDYGAGISVGGP